MKLFYRQYGSGPPLLLLHGLLGSSDNLHSIALGLQDRFEVFVPDLRNHGRSPHSEGFSYPLMASDISELVKHLDLKKVNLVGHSMGGKVAIEFALAYPDVLQHLVVVDITPGRTAPRYRNHLKALLDMDLSSVHSRSDAERMFSAHINDRMIMLFLLKNLKKAAAGEFGWKANLPAIAAHYDAIWTELEGKRSWLGPSLVIRGSRSDTVADRRLAELYEYLPNAQIETVMDTGHWLHTEATEKFISLVAGFLTDRAWDT